MLRVRGVAAVPILDRGIPISRDLREGKDACACVFAAFCVVSCRRGQSVLACLQTLPLQLVKTGHRQLVRCGIAADFIERKQPPEAIEGRVFHRFRHQRSGELLKLQCKIAHTRGAVAGIAGEVERDCVVQEIENLRIGSFPARART